MTRSKTKRQHQQPIPNVSAPGEIISREEKDLIDETKVEVELINDIIKTRHEFMQELFGKRNNMKIHNINEIIKLQQADNAIRLAIKLVTTKKIQWTQNDVQLMQQMEVIYF